MIAEYAELTVGHPVYLEYIVRGAKNEDVASSAFEVRRESASGQRSTQNLKKWSSGIAGPSGNPIRVRFRHKFFQAQNFLGRDGDSL